MVDIFRPPYFQPVSVNGVPLAGAKLYFYTAGTTTPITVYQDVGLSTPHASPVVADASGIFAAIYVNTATYKIALYTSADVLVKTYDNVNSPSLFDSIYTKGIDIASASTLDLDSATGPFIDITGTTTVTGVTLTAGRRREARAVAAFTLTASATLIVNGSAAVNYTTVAGDFLIFEGYSAGIVRVWNVSGSSAATTSAFGTVGLTQLGLAYNVGITSSVGASALTVSLVGADGNAPSATNPVVIPFRNATLATGTPVLRTVTAATSIVVASTKTLGTTSATAFRLWLVAVDTGSGIELGLVNCLSGTSIMALLSSQLYSPTATPGNSAQVIYTTSGQTSKPICVLGYLDFSSGEATAGTWATAADRIQVRNLGTKLPGDLIQQPNNIAGASATGTTTIPADDTIPQNTEGTQFLTQAITPVGAANLLHVLLRGEISPSATGTPGVAALFRDSTANAVAVDFNQLDSNRTFAIDYWVLAGATAATTFNARFGGAAANTFTFNGAGSARQYGGAMASFIRIEEFMA